MAASSAARRVPAGLHTAGIPDGRPRDRTGMGRPGGIRNREAGTSEEDHAGHKKDQGYKGGKAHWE